MKHRYFLLILFTTSFILTVSSFQLLAQEKVNIFRELSEFMEKFEKKCPGVAESFYALHDTIVNKEGVLSIKEKELIALGIGISRQCEYCIYFHTARAMENGATEEEILEAASVAIYMGGGPAFSYIKYVIDALEELSVINESNNSEK